MKSYVVTQKWKKLIVLTSRPNSAFLPCGASVDVEMTIRKVATKTRKRFTPFIISQNLMSTTLGGKCIHKPGTYPVLCAYS